MGRSKVAVIMPCYNAGKFLARTIDSVLRQSYKNFHLVCGNDGSTDNTAQILESYSGRITAINHPDHGNHGQAATYNLCLKHIDSEYIAFIDSDDVWRADKLEKQVDVLDSQPETGFVYTNGNVIDGDDRILHPLLSNSHREKNEVGDILLDCYIRTPSSVMVRSSIMQAAGEFRVGIIPDHDMWIRFRELTRFAYLEDRLTSYRVHDRQLSKTAAERMWREGFGTLTRALNRYPYPAHIKRKRLAVIHYRLGQCSSKKNSIVALYHLIRAFTYDPFRSAFVIKKTLDCL